MCGRFILAQAAKAERAMAIRRGRWEYAMSYRVMPTDQVPVVIMRGARHAVAQAADEGRLGQTMPGRMSVHQSERTAAMMRWGFIPFWAHGVPPKLSTINARVERMERAPMFKDAWNRNQRCILVMGGFYEPHVNEDGSRDPFFLHLADREVFGVAGLWDRSRNEDGTVVYSCTLITLPASPLLADIHNEKQRMPAILAEEDHESWLTGSQETAKAVLKPYPDELIVAWKVSRKVNSPRAPNDASLIEPVPRPLAAGPKQEPVSTPLAAGPKQHPEPRQLAPERASSAKPSRTPELEQASDEPGARTGDSDPRPAEPDAAPAQADLFR